MIDIKNTKVEVKHASRAYDKLKAAIDQFNLVEVIKDKIVADFGSSTGGFVEALIEAGATKVYSVDTARNAIDYKLRIHPKVELMERTNAMHVTLPELMDFVSIDTSWTKQDKVIPNAVKNIKHEGFIVTLVKPHYEAKRDEMKKGVTIEDKIPQILERVEKVFEENNLKIIGKIKSPVLGRRGGNEEWLYFLKLKNDNLKT